MLDVAAEPVVDGYLYLAYGDDPISGDISMYYTENQAEHADVGRIDTIGYTLGIKEYDGIATNLPGSFEFKIACSTHYIEDAYSPAS